MFWPGGNWEPAEHVPAVSQPSEGLSFPLSPWFLVLRFFVFMFKLLLDCMEFIDVWKKQRPRWERMREAVWEAGRCQALLGAMLLHLRRGSPL